MIKTATGSFAPATQADLELTQSLKIGKEYGVTLTQLRNGKFHRKIFALLNYLYDALPKHTAEYKGQQVEQSFTSFRKMMVAMAGHYEIEVTASDCVRAVATSISYKECSQQKAEQIYSDVIDKALELLGGSQSRDDLDEIVNNILRFD